MILHENRLLADDSHVNHSLFLSKIRKDVAKLRLKAPILKLKLRRGQFKVMSKRKLKKKYIKIYFLTDPGMFGM